MRIRSNQRCSPEIVSNRSSGPRNNSPKCINRNEKGKPRPNKAQNQGFSKSHKGRFVIPQPRQEQESKSVPVRIHSPGIALSLRWARILAFTSKMSAAALLLHTLSLLFAFFSTSSAHYSSSFSSSSSSNSPSSASSSLSEWTYARATYYAAADPRDAVGGACGYGDLVKSGFGMATVGLSESLFERGQICGACFELRCVDDLRWCIPGTSIIVTATNFCAPNYGFPANGGGRCNPPNKHFVLPIEAFEKIAIWKAGNMPVQYRR